ncbi:MAG: hypothetical protein WD572_07305 [Gammaproteobacteria bacterium]
MNKQTDNPEAQTALAEAWHQDSAYASLERWLELVQHEHWSESVATLQDIVRVFGASWSFTRYLFYRGPAALPLFAATMPADFDRAAIRTRLQQPADADVEAALDALRIEKNGIMLQLLLADLRGQFDQETIEQFLTTLAEETLSVALKIYSDYMQIDMAHALSVLGMGRMAGNEMNFGSDLDLIFLYARDADDNNSDEHNEELTQAMRLVRMLLRGIAMTSPAGSLYEVDMRLRPHGKAGALVSSRESFVDYHAVERDIWERQMMTRCRPVVDPNNTAASVLEKVNASIYTQYDHDFLRTEIRQMRARVEHELGSPAGYHDIKRGKGGVMDIDFISHYLQLAHGYKEQSLQTGSTRQALRAATQLGYLSETHCQTLLQAYDFLKTIESRMRVFDMKPVSRISREADACTTLARSMHITAADDAAAGAELLERYRAVSAEVRGIFDSVLAV